MTDTEGVQRKNGALISELTRKEANKLIKVGAINDGMLPKVTCCLASLKAGVKKTHIIDGRIRHALLLELFTEEGIGTQMVA